MRLLSTSCVLALLWLTSPALAQSRALPSTVQKIVSESTQVVRTLSSGQTTLQRYRSHRAGSALPANTELVLILKMRQINSPDTVTVTSAVARGKRITVRIETRRFTGPLAANVVTTPYVEIALGKLSKGRYDIRFRETVLEFDKYSQPNTAKNPKRGISGSISFEVR